MMPARIRSAGCLGGYTQSFQTAHHDSFAPSGLAHFSLCTHGLRPFGSAQGRLWAAFCRRFAAGVGGAGIRLRVVGGADCGPVGLGRWTAEGGCLHMSPGGEKLSRGWEGANEGKVVIALSKYLWKLCHF
jgi:hypothetical protein